MKARPRSIERKVAAELNSIFEPLHLSLVERIPVLGRTGPDISLNELKLVIDVKSRLEVPKSLFFPLLTPFCFENMIAARLCVADMLWGETFDHPALLDFSSKIVDGYMAHMDEWTRKECPDGISCVVLHRPEAPIGDAVVIIYSKDRRRLVEYARKYISTDPRQ